MTDDATLSDFDSGEATNDDPDEQRSDSSRAEVETAGRAPDDSETADGEPVDGGTGGETTDGDSADETHAHDSEASDDTADELHDGDDDAHDGDDEAHDGDDETLDGGVDGETERSTYAWGSYTCSRCETETKRVWRDDGDFVCPACKPW